MRLQPPPLVLSMALGLSLSLSSGCVAKAEYDSALQDLDSARKAYGDVEQQLADCQAQGEAALAELEARLEAELADRLAASEAELAELRRQRAVAEERLAAFNELNEKLADLIAAGDLEVYIRNGLPVIALPSEVLFATGKAELSKKGTKPLAKVGKALASMKGQRVQVAGHTDNQPMKKSSWDDNWQLSTERALTVTRVLIEQGVDPGVLSAAGYGEFDPVGNNDSKQGRKKNRRIELVLLPDLSELQPISEASASN